MNAVSHPPLALDRDQRWGRTLTLNVILGILLVGMLAVSIAFGANVTLNPLLVIDMITNPQSYDRLEPLSANLRLPRALLAILVGATLAMSGALLQSLYRNPLADPGLTGVTGGAIAFVGIYRIFGPQIDPAWVGIITPMLAIGGGLTATAITWFFASLSGRSQSINLILIGVLVGGFFSSGMTIAFLWAPSFEMLHSLLSWFVGSFYKATWMDVVIVSVGVLLISPLIVMSIPRGNVMQLGDSIAQGLGQPVVPARGLVLLTACLLAGLAVCTVGGVGFVGLMAPHMVRWYVGTDLRRLLPTVALLGGTLVMSLDFVARTFRTSMVGDLLGIPMNPQSLPVGLFLNLVGGIFFLFLLRKLRG
jgi:iron complex transport system permease protein